MVFTKVLIGFQINWKMPNKDLWQRILSKNLFTYSFSFCLLQIHYWKMKKVRSRFLSFFFFICISLISSYSFVSIQVFFVHVKQVFYLYKNIHSFIHSFLSSRCFNDHFKCWFFFIFCLFLCVDSLLLFRKKKVRRWKRKYRQWSLSVPKNILNTHTFTWIWFRLIKHPTHLHRSFLFQNSNKRLEFFSIFFVLSDLCKLLIRTNNKTFFFSLRRSTFSNDQSKMKIDINSFLLLFLLCTTETFSCKSSMFFRFLFNLTLFSIRSSWFYRQISR